MTSRTGPGRWLPGLSGIAALSPREIPREIAAGASVAAVSIPIGLADAALVGLPPVYGLYASIVPTLVYALVGPSSRYLIVGPDAAICLLLGASLTQFGLIAGEDRAAAAAGLTLLVGIACLAAAGLRLGFIANLISNPVLVGYMCGVSIILMASQVPNFTGFEFDAQGIIRQFIELFQRSAEIHWPTMILGLCLFASLRAGKRLLPQIPGPAVAIVVAILLSWLLDFRGAGMASIGSIPAGLPLPRLPTIAGDPRSVTLSVIGLLIVGFSSGILTARSFGERLGKNSDPNRELIGFGASDIAGGLFQGFAVTGGDSRTAMAIDVGGKSALVGVIAAIGVALAVALLAAPLSLLPKAALGAILFSIAIDLFDLSGFIRLRRIDTAEFGIAVFATIGVVWIGVLLGVFIAVLLTLAHLIRVIAVPRDAVIGRAQGSGELVTLHRDKTARVPDRIVVYLFQASILFVNAEFFGRRALVALRRVPGARYYVLDASAMMIADSAAVDALTRLKIKLDKRGIVLMIGGGHGRFRDVVERSGLAEMIGRHRLFPTPEAALAAAEALRDAQDDDKNVGTDSRASRDST